MLVVLAIVWAAVLIPPMLRARAEGSPADSIGNFRRQLKVLQRTAPRAVAPANTLAATPRYVAPQPVPTYRLARTFTPESSRRARTLRRRRDVLFALMAGMGLTFLLALLPGFEVLWGAHLLIDAAFVGYIAMLVRMRNLAAEREMKLRFLPGATVSREPALALRRSAN
ncbi:MAG TPA: hypothetical protein VHE80_02145 [Acidimicrobiales bacterium]|nr:hypothetical protein [Acidimicrobiales bacterium]